MTGQRRQGARAELLVELRGALEQTAVQVEDVARVRLAAWWAPQEQRELTVRLGLLREVVVDDERVVAVVHPVLTHRATGIRSEVLEHCLVGGRRVDHDRVLHRAVRLERRHGLCDRRALLADRDVDALHALAALIEDRVDRDGGLARLAVTDDQLTLPATDRGHGVDRLDPGLERLVHGLASHDAGRLHLEAPGFGGSDRALAVDGLTERVDDTANERVANRNREDPARRLDWVAFFHDVGLAQDHGTDRVFVEVQRETQGPTFELEQLVHCGLGQPSDARDAVADFQHASNARGLDRRRKRVDVGLERRRDLVDADRQLWAHNCSFI